MTLSTNSLQGSYFFSVFVWADMLLRPGKASVEANNHSIHPMPAMRTATTVVASSYSQLWKQRQDLESLRCYSFVRGANSKVSDLFANSNGAPIISHEHMRLVTLSSRGDCPLLIGGGGRAPPDGTVAERWSIVIGCLMAVNCFGNWWADIFIVGDLTPSMSR